MSLVIPPFTPVFRTASVTDTLGGGDIVMPSQMGSAYIVSTGSDDAFFNFDNGMAVITGDSLSQLSNLQMTSQVPRNIVFYITIQHAGGLYTVRVYADSGLTQLLCKGSSSFPIANLVLADSSVSTLTGLLSGTASSASIVGVGTLFLSELINGDQIVLNPTGTNPVTVTVATVLTNTTLTLASPLVQSYPSVHAKLVSRGVSGVVSLNYAADSLSNTISFVDIVAVEQNGQFRLQKGVAVNLDDISYSRINFLCATGKTATVDVIAVPRTGVGQD